MDTMQTRMRAEALKRYTRELTVDDHRLYPGELLLINVERLADYLEGQYFQSGLIAFYENDDLGFKVFTKRSEEITSPDDALTALQEAKLGLARIATHLPIGDPFQRYLRERCEHAAYLLECYFDWQGNAWELVLSSNGGKTTTPEFRSAYLRSNTDHLAKVFAEARIELREVLRNVDDLNAIDSENVDIVEVKACLKTLLFMLEGEEQVVQVQLVKDAKSILDHLKDHVPWIASVASAGAAITALYLSV